MSIRNEHLGLLNEVDVQATPFIFDDWNSAVETVTEFVDRSNKQNIWSSYAEAAKMGASTCC